jgi:dienelactone hydrolase
MFLLVTVVLGLLAGCAAAPPPPAGPPLRTPTPPVSPRQLLLAEPRGPLPTGTTRVTTTDPARHDDLTPGPRELVTQIWYPTAVTGVRPADYAPPGEAAALAASYPVPAGAFAPASTHSAPDAPALPGPHPLVLVTHGLCGAGTDLTALSEQLASEGYVVAATASPGEAVAVQFPGGRTVGITDPAACATAADSTSAAGQAVIARLQATRVADQRHVLDVLSRRAGLPHGLDAAVDPTRVAGVGHSFGGSTMFALAHDDPRVAAAVDLDGFLLGSGQQLAKPALILGSGYHDPAGDPSWAAAFDRLSGWHRWIRITGAGHYRLMDLGPSAERWQLRTTMPPQAWEQVFGDVDGVRVQRIVADYTSAFLDRFLRGAPAPVLDGPSPGYPDVRFPVAGAG